MRSELVTTLAIAANSASGLLAQVVLAAVFGAGAELDAFFGAAAAPTAVVGLGITAFGSAIIPTLAFRRVHNGPSEEAEHRLLGAIVLISAVVAVGGYGLTRSIAEPAPRTAEVAVRLVPHLLPWLWVACFAGLVGQGLTAMLHMRRRFLLATLTASLYSLALIAGALTLGERIGVRALAVGYALAASLQCVLLAGALRPAGALRLAPPRTDDLAVLRRSLPVLLAVLPSTCFVISDTYWTAARGSGGLSYLVYASRLTVAVAAIVTTGTAMVSFPQLSELASTRRMEQFSKLLERSIVRAALVLVPLAVLGFALRGDLVRLLFERGAFESSDWAVLVAILPYYLIGMVCLGCSNVAIRGFYALRDYRTPAVIGVAALALYVGLSGVLVGRGAYGIALAYAVMWCAAVAAQLLMLRRRLGRLLNARGAGLLLGPTALVAALAATVGRLKRAGRRILLRAIERMAGRAAVGGGQPRGAARVMLVRATSLGDFAAFLPYVTSAFREYGAANVDLVLVSRVGDVARQFLGPAVACRILVVRPGPVGAFLRDALRARAALKPAGPHRVIYAGQSAEGPMSRLKKLLLLRLLVGASAPLEGLAAIDAVSGQTVSPTTTPFADASIALDVFRRTGRTVDVSREEVERLLDFRHDEAEKVAELLRDTAGRNVVGFHVWARLARKRWPLERFEEVCRALFDDGTMDTAVILGGEEDKAAAEALATRFLRRDMRVLAGRLTVRETILLMRRLRLMVGNDASPIHMAALTGTPVVSVFCAYEPAGLWEPTLSSASHSIRPAWSSPPTPFHDREYHLYGIDRVPAEPVSSAARALAGAPLSDGAAHKLTVTDMHGAVTVDLPAFPFRRSASSVSALGRGLTAVVPTRPNSSC